MNSVLLYWLPLGAGGHVVGANGQLYERWCAWRAHRAPVALFHAALEVSVDGVGYVIEMAPVWGNGPGERGVVAEGPVGLRVLGRSRFFRYEVRSWAGGAIPDVEYAVGGPVTMSEQRERSTALLDLVPTVPTFTWGRDALRVGDMWNSNSLVAWLLAGSGHDTDAIAPPDGGRAPGWASGLALAAERGYR